MAGRRLPEVWASSHSRTAAFLSCRHYLLVPWLFDLPMSILWHWTLFMTVTRIDSVFAFVNGPTSLLVGGCFGICSRSPQPCLTTVVYLRRDAEVSPFPCSPLWVIHSSS